MLKCHDDDIAGKTIVVSGAGNVAIYAIEKCHQLGAKVVTCSDSTANIMKDAEYGLLNVMLLFHVLLRMSSSLKTQNS